MRSRVYLLMPTLGEQHKLLQAALRELEVALLGIHLPFFGLALDELHPGPVLAVHVAAGLPRVSQTGRERDGYLAGAQGSPVHI